MVIIQAIGMCDKCMRETGGEEANDPLWEVMDYDNPPVPKQYCRQCTENFLYKYMTQWRAVVGETFPLKKEVGYLDAYINNPYREEDERILAEMVKDKEEQEEEEGKNKHDY